ncbi:MAG: hypothetical protein J6C37_03060 [Roseburia sp.]|nr:hypothetical protein [Roseburia sp.]
MIEEKRHADDASIRLQNVVCRIQIRTWIIDFDIEDFVMKTGKESRKNGIASLPMLIAYPFVQKYFVKGVMVGSVKG